MLIMVKVLSAQQNWDVSTGETENALILEYRGWQFSAPISDDDLQGVLAAMRIDAAQQPGSAQLRTAELREVQEPPVVPPPAVFAAGPTAESREDRLAAMRERARTSPQQLTGTRAAPRPVTEADLAPDEDEDGFQQG